jgi:hypothetical protein
MVAKRSDYTTEAVDAARSVLSEPSRLIGKHQDSVVVMGGQVPELLLSRALYLHVGSIDMNLALDHRKIKEVGYNQFCSFCWRTVTGRAKSLSSFSAQPNWESRHLAWK